MCSQGKEHCWRCRRQWKLMVSSTQATQQPGKWESRRHTGRMERCLSIPWTLPTHLFYRCRYWNWNFSKAKTRNLSGFSASRPEKLTHYQSHQRKVPGFMAWTEGSKRMESFLFEFTSSIPRLINCSQEHLSQGRVWKVYLSRGHLKSPENILR